VKRFGDEEGAFSNTNMQELGSCEIWDGICEFLAREILRKKLLSNQNWIQHAEETSASENEETVNFLAQSFPSTT
jgi:predicted RNA-binding protein with PUA-like domain